MVMVPPLAATALAMAILVAQLAPAGAAPSPGALPDPVPCPGCWQPPVGTTWQYQLTGAIDTTVDAEAFSVDLFDVPRTTISELQDAGRRVVCYLSAGSWEEWRPDAGRYARSVLGEPLEGWPGERWLDIRRLDVLAPILRDRLDRCAAKGFDGVDPDNVDGFANDTGFPLTAADQRRFDAWLANAAHRRGLSVGLKNTLELIPALLPYFDFAIDEECFRYRECTRLRPFIEAGRSVVVVEYELPRTAFCDRADELGLFAIRKRLSLGPWRRPCP
jgi:hypothetical protein